MPNATCDLMEYHGSKRARAKAAYGCFALMTLALFVTLVVPATSALASPPNVVVIMADDLDEGSLNTLLANELMPKLKKRLLDRGTRFVNSFVTTSWCCPSRATFLSGQYSHNHRVQTNGKPLGGVWRFDDSSTLATWLHAAGYRTGLVGKYLNGYGRNNDPATPVDNPTYVPPGWDDWQALIDGGVDGKRLFQVYNYTLNDNGTLVAYGALPSDYQTDVFAKRALQFLNESEVIDDAQPFFLEVTPIAPHLERPGPVLSGCTNETWNGTIRPAPRHVGTLPPSVTLPKPPNFNEADMSDKPAWFQALPSLTSEDIVCLGRQYRDRLESLRAVDDLIGKIVNTLIQNGELANTVLIFTSDNGFFLGEHRLTDKKFGYEESIRVPLIIRAPGFVGPQITTRFALNNDLAPTIVAFAGATATLAMDGRSLISLLQNPAKKVWRKRFLVELLSGLEVGDPVAFSAVRTGPLSLDAPDKFYVEWDDPAVTKEFYNLPADPHERTSQHENPVWASIRSILAGWLTELKTCGEGTCQTSEN